MVPKELMSEFRELYRKGVSLTNEAGKYLSVTKVLRVLVRPLVPDAVESGVEMMRVAIVGLEVRPVGRHFLAIEAYSLVNVNDLAHELILNMVGE
jgi:hypothetical protein